MRSFVKQNRVARAEANSGLLSCVAAKHFGTSDSFSFLDTRPSGAEGKRTLRDSASLSSARARESPEQSLQILRSALSRSIRADHRPSAKTIFHAGMQLCAECASPHELFR